MHIKQILFNHCLSYIDQRIGNAEYALNSARESANNDTKSSSGDKHETGRAMAQLEQEKASQMITEANLLKQILIKIKPNYISKNIALGSLVITNRGTYYIAISAGKIIVDQKEYNAISTNSPIGSKLIGSQQKSSFQLNDIIYQIEEIL